jgi:hypothetical protein
MEAGIYVLFWKYLHGPFLSKKNRYNGILILWALAVSIKVSWFGGAASDVAG